MTLRIPNIVLNKLQVDALGETSVRYNLMSEACAVQLDECIIDRSDMQLVRIGNGDIVTTCGTVKTSPQFPGESELYSVLFHLLSQWSYNAILGNSFLKSIETFINTLKYARRVVKRILGGIQGHDFFYISGSGSMFKRELNGQFEYAFTDTGEKVLIMDEEHVLRLGLDIVTDPQHRTSLQFADDSTALTFGMVYGIRWQYGDGVNGERHLMNFHILKNAPTAIILREDFLLRQGRNAFAEYSCYVIDNQSKDDLAGCFVIERDTSCIDGALDTEENWKLLKLIRHGNEDDWVATLHVDD